MKDFARDFLAGVGIIATVAGMVLILDRVAQLLR